MINDTTMPFSLLMQNSLNRGYIRKPYPDRRMPSFAGYNPLYPYKSFLKFAKIDFKRETLINFWTTNGLLKGPVLVTLRVLVALPLDADIEQARALLLLLIVNLTSEDLSLLQRLGVMFPMVNKKDSLLPVGLSSVRPGSKGNDPLLLHVRGDSILGDGGISRGHEEDVKPDRPAIESVNILLEGDLEFLQEGQFVDSDGMQRQRQEHSRVCRDGSGLNAANESLVIDVH